MTPTTVRFLHLADTHLGYEQYGSDHRYRDYFDTFERAIDDAVSEKVNFVIIAGDLFHQRTISPQTLIRAVRGLERLKQVSIPVVGVVGNHDWMLLREDDSWLDFLASCGLMILLAPFVNKERRLEYAPFDGSVGGYVDIGSARIYGLPYHGHTTAEVLKDTISFLEQRWPQDRQPVTILVTHAGLEGVLPRFSATLSMEHVMSLRPFLDYLALGHIHKPFSIDDWIFNPGSLEPLEMSEIEYGGGGYLVEIDPQRQQTVQATLRRYAQRPFLRLSLDISQYETPAEIYGAVNAHLTGHPRPCRQPVVEYSLEGIKRFADQFLDLAQIEDMIKGILHPIVTRARDRSARTEYEFSDCERTMERDELERQVFMDLLVRDSRYQVKAEYWASVIQELKHNALEDTSPASIVEHIRRALSAHVGVDSAFMPLTAPPLADARSLD